MKGLEFLNTLEQWNGQGGFCPYNIKKVMQFLGNPQDKIPSIHVAGTNGKGSVCAAIAAILGAAGFDVGLNISPHLARLNERIVINGNSIGDDLLDQAALELKKCLSTIKVKLSYHEALTAIAFLVYYAMKLDWIVVEAGLGGRLDASNVLSCPEACVITSIGFDHQHILGSTKREIAREKAGIIKKGSRLFVGNMNDEPLREICSVAETLQVPTLCWGSDYIVEILPRANGNGYSMCYRDLKKERQFVFHPSLKGAFQKNNMALAINVAQSLGLSELECIKGLEGVYWPARFEKITVGDSFVIFDCAHNTDGFSALAESLEFEGLRDLCVGFGCLETKNWQEMVKILIPYADRWKLLLPQSTRAVPNKVVAEYLSCFGIKTEDYGTDYKRFLEEHAGKKPLLLVGSMYMVGGLRALHVKEERPLWYKEIKVVENAPRKDQGISRHY